MKTYIGCPGFYYDDWKGRFYSESLPRSSWINYFSLNFNSVKINSTLYRMPEEETLKKWYNLTPDQFVFTVK
jgi:uncharacterized protein YecE (DUF72 family)